MKALPTQLPMVAARKPFLYLVSTPNRAGSVMPRMPDRTEAVSYTHLDVYKRQT